MTFANIRNEEIIDFNSLYLDKDIIRIETSEEIYQSYLEDKNKVIYKDGEVTLNSNYEEEARVKREELINKLTMTSLDFINVLRSLGLSLEQIRSYLSNNIELDTQLTYCRDVFCGVVRQLLPIEYEGITITDDMVVKAFKSKNNIE